MKALGFDPTDQEVTDIVQSLDTDGNTAIDYSSLCIDYFLCIDPEFLLTTNSYTLTTSSYVLTVNSCAGNMELDFNEFKQVMSGRMQAQPTLLCPTIC